MQDLCPDEVNYAGVRDFLDEFCTGLSDMDCLWATSSNISSIGDTQVPSPVDGGYGSSDVASASGYYASGVPFQYLASGTP